MKGSGIDLATEELGSQRVGAISCMVSSVSGGVNERVRLARLTVGAGISQASTEDVNASYPWTYAADLATAKVLGFGADEFAAVWSGPGNTHHVKRIGSGSVAHLGSTSPADSVAFGADYSADDEAVYVYTWRGGGLYRAPWFTATAALGSQVLVANVADADLRSIRTPEAVVDGRFIDVHYAYGSAGFARLQTSHNRPPTAPTVPSIEPFDAANAKTLPWTFNDPNPSDSQSARRVVIERTDTGATVTDTGKVVSATESYLIPAATLTNGMGYRVQVYTWDEADEASPPSAWRAFSPSAAATISVTNPPPGANLITSSL